MKEIVSPTHDNAPISLARSRLLAALRFPMKARSTEDTSLIATYFAELLEPGDVVLLRGELGSGKTTFSKAVIQALCEINPEEVTSPTFTYVHEYSPPFLDRPPIFHFDLYRLAAAEDFISLGLDEYFERGGICLVEWPEKCEGVFPGNAWEVRLIHTENGREITFSHSVFTQERGR